MSGRHYFYQDFTKIVFRYFQLHWLETEEYFIHCPRRWIHFYQNIYKQGILSRIIAILSPIDQWQISDPSEDYSDLQHNKSNTDKDYNQAAMAGYLPTVRKSPKGTRKLCATQV